MLLSRSSLSSELDCIRQTLARTKWVYIAETKHCGLGIFAGRTFIEGDAIVCDAIGDYYNGALTYSQIRSLGLDLSRDCFQIDVDRFLLPRGSVDDLINHSCRPNAGIRLNSLGYELLALRKINVGDEITYDYSTYIDSPEWMRCDCNSVCCRRQVGRFRDLDPHLQAYYLERGVVGAFAAIAAAAPAWSAVGEAVA